MYFLFLVTISELTEELAASAQAVVNGLQVLEVVSPQLVPVLRPQVLSLLPLLLSSLCSAVTAVRHMAARCIATLAHVDLHHTMQVRGVGV